MKVPWRDNSLDVCCRYLHRCWEVFVSLAVPLTDVVPSTRDSRDRYSWVEVDCSIPSFWSDFAQKGHVPPEGSWPLRRVLGAPTETPERPFQKSRRVGSKMIRWSLRASTAGDSCWLAGKEKWHAFAKNPPSRDISFFSGFPENRFLPGPITPARLPSGPWLSPQALPTGRQRLRRPEGRDREGHQRLGGIHGCGSKPMVPFWDWDVRWGYDLDFDPSPHPPHFEK